MLNRKLSKVWKVALAILISFTCMEMLSTDLVDAKEGFDIDYTISKQEDNNIIEFNLESVSEDYVIEEIKTPEEISMDLMNPTYEVSENGVYDFEIKYYEKNDETGDVLTYHKEITINDMEEPEAEKEIDKEVVNEQTISPHSSEEQSLPSKGTRASIVFNGTTFPDSNFRDYLSAEHGWANNQILSDADLNAITDIYVFNKNISSVKGIEYFPNLKTLDVSRNTSLASLDVTQNTKLVSIKAVECRLISIDVSKCLDLEILDLNVQAKGAAEPPISNGLTSINVTNNTKLKKLVVGNSAITAIDISNNLDLEYLDISRNKISSINVTPHTELKLLYVYQNDGITSVDVTNNTKLEALSASQTGITELDLSNNPDLWYLDSYRTGLAEIDLSNNPELTFLNLADNKLEELDLTYNTKLGLDHTNVDGDGSTNGALHVDANHLVQLEVDHLQFLTEAKTTHAGQTNKATIYYEDGIWKIDMSTVVDPDNIGYVDPTSTTGLVNGVTVNITYDPNTGIGIFDGATNPNIPPTQMKYDYITTYMSGGPDEMDVTLTLYGVYTSKTVTDASGDGLVSPGESFTYTLTVENKGATAMTDVFVKDDLASVKNHLTAGYELTSIAITNGTTSTAKVEDLMTGITIPSIAAGGKLTIKFTVTAKTTLDTTSVTSLDNEAFLAGIRNEASIDTGDSNLVVIKTVADSNDADAIASPGEELTYTIKVENTGNADAANVVVKDGLDDLLDYINTTGLSATAVSVSGSNPNSTLGALMGSGITIAKIAPNETVTITFKVTLKTKLDEGVSKPETLINTVYVNDDEGTKAEIDYGDTDLVTTKTVSDTDGDNIASPGETLNYEITIKNEGKVDAVNVNVKDDLAQLYPDYINNPSTNIVEMIDGYGVSTWSSVHTLMTTGLTIPKIEAGKTITVKFTVTVKDAFASGVTTPSKLENVVYVDGEEGDDAKITYGEPELVVTKEVEDDNKDGMAAPGEELEYTITVTNDGDVAAKNVLIQDEMATLSAYLKAHDGAVVTIDNDGVTTTTTIGALKNPGITIGSIAHGKTVTLTFKVTVIDNLDVDMVTVLSNTVKVNDEPTTEVIPTGDSDLIVTKKVDDKNQDGMAAPGEELEYTITVMNDGDVAATDVLIRDEMTTLSTYLKVHDSATVTINNNGTLTKSTVGLLKNPGITIGSIASGKTVTLIFKVTVVDDLDVDTVTVLSNTVKVNDVPTTEIIPTGDSDLVVTKEVEDDNKDGIATPGEELEYTITVTNDGDVAATNVLVQDEMTTLSTYLKAHDSAVVTIDNDGVTTTSTIGALKNPGITIASIASGKTVSITFKVTVLDDLDVDTVTVLSNTVKVDDVPTTETIPTGDSDLVVTKEVEDDNNDGIAAPGEELEYTITVTNDGDVAATNVLVQDEMTTLSTYLKAHDSAVVTIDNDGVTTTSTIGALKNPGITIGSIASGKTVQLTFKVTVVDNLDVDTVTVLSNTVKVDDEPTTEIIPTGDSDLVVAKKVTDNSGDGMAAPGEELEYRITIRNDGDVAATNVLIQDEMTTLSTYLKAHDSATVTINNNGTLTTSTVGLLKNPGITIASVASGETVTLIFKVTVADDLDVDTVTVLSNTVKVDDEPTTETIPTGDSDLVVTKEVEDDNKDGIAAPGEELEYTITVTNDGDVAATNVLVQDEMTTLSTYLKAHDSAVVTIDNNGVTTTSTVGALKNPGITIASIASGKTAKLTFKVTVVDDLDVDTVTVLSNTVKVNDVPTTETIPTGDSDLVVTKEVEDDNKDGIAAPGEELEYTITIRNDGDVAATNVLVRDEMTTLSTYLKAHDSAVVSINNDGVTTTSTIGALKNPGITIGSIVSGKTVKLTFKVTVVDDLDVGTVTVLSNTVKVDDEPTTETIPTGDGDLVVTKEVEDDNKDGMAAPGEELEYTITIKNDGDVAATNVLVQDEMTTLSTYLKAHDSAVITIENDGVTTTSTVGALKNPGITIGSIASGKIVKLTFKVMVADDLDVDTVTVLSNTVKVDDEPTTEIIPTGDSNLVVTKEVKDDNQDGMAAPGEELEYTITVENDGDVAATNVLVQDEMTTLSTYLKAHDSAIVTINNNGTITTSTVGLLKNPGITIGSIASSKTVTLTFKVTVVDDLDVDTVTILSNTVKVDDEPTTEIIPTGDSNLVVAKKVTDNSGDGMAAPGEELEYTITIRNDGDVAATNVLVQDEMTTLSTYLKAHDSAVVSIDNDGVTTTSTVGALKNPGITIASIASGKTVKLTFKVTVVDDLDVDTVTVLSNTVKVDDEPTTEIIPTGDSDLVVTKDVKDDSQDGMAAPGEELEYTITIKNDGSVAASNVLVQDKMTTLSTYLKAHDSAVVTIDNDGVTTTSTIGALKNPGITIASISSDKTVTLTFKVTVVDDLDVDTVTILSNTVEVNGGKITEEIPTGDSDLVVTKEVDDDNQDGMAAPGEELEYTITIRNDGDVAATNVLVQDEMTTLSTYLKAHDSSVVTIDNDGVTTTSTVGALKNPGITIGTITSGKTVTLTFKVTVADDLDVNTVTVLSNTVKVDDEPTTEIIPTGDSDLVVTKEVEDDNQDGMAAPGEELEYTITVKNDGDVDATNVLIQDKMTTLSTYLKTHDSATVTINNNGVITTTTVGLLKNPGITIGSIASGKMVTLKFKVTVEDDLDVDTVTVLSNTVEVDDKPTTEIIPTGDSDLVVTKEVEDDNQDGMATPGEELEYKITVRNDGDVAASNVLIQDKMTALSTYLKAHDGAVVTINNDGMTTTSTIGALKNPGITIASIASGKTVTLTFKVTVVDDLDVDTVTVLSNTVEVDDKPTTEIIPTGDSDLVVTKKVEDDNQDGMAAPGEELEYTIAVRNDGDVAATNVLIQDKMTALSTYLKAHDSAVVTIDNDGVITTSTISILKNPGITIASIAAGKTVTLTFKVTVVDDLDVDSITHLSNTVEVNGEPTTETIPTGDSDLLVTKEVADASQDGYASPGEELTYTITVKNDGTVAATNVLVQDKMTTLSAHLKMYDNAIVTINNNGVITTSTIGTLKNTGITIPTIASGTTITLKFKVTVVDDLDVDTITILSNTVEVNGWETTEEIPTGDSNLIVTKVAEDANQNGYASPGEELMYTIKVENTGTLAANNVVIQDTLSLMDTYINDPNAEVVSIDNNGTLTTSTVGELRNPGIIISSIDPLATVTLTFKVTVKDDLDMEVVSELKNTVLVNDEPTTEIIPTGDSKLIAEKTVVDEDGDALASPGEKLDYTIRVKNSGQLDESGVVIQDDLSLLEGHVDYALSDLVEVNNDGMITHFTIQDLITGITIPTIEVDKEVTVHFTVTVKESLDNETISILSNVAKVNGKEVNCEIPVVDAVYTIVYHGNGHTAGIEPADSRLYYANEQVTLLNKNDLIKSNHSYVSWNTKADGSGTSYYAADIKECLALYNEAGDGNRTIHLYAIWNRVEKKPSVATGDDTNKTVTLSLSMLLMSAFAIIMVRSKKRKSL